jgi:hypothetical protein
MYGYVNGYDFYNMTAEKYWAPTKNTNIQELVKNAIQSNGYMGSRKVDGHWYMIIKDEEGNLIFRGRSESVNGGYHNKIGHVPHLKAEFDKLPNGTVYIGELYFANKEGSRNVTTIMGCLEDKAIKRQEKGEKLSFYAFDCLAYDGHIIMGDFLEKRITMLNKLPKHDNISLAKYYVGEKLLEFIAYCRAKGWEGVVLQSKDGTYEPGKRPARKSIKVKKELDNEIDCFLTGTYKPSTWDYTGKEIEEWTYWWDDKNQQKLEGKYYLHHLDGEPIFPITKGAFYGWAGAVEIGVLKDEEVYPIGWISNVTEEIKQKITEENSPLKYQVCKVSAMLIEEDTKALRHARIMEWREDISYKDCTYEKAFGGTE